jgi:hypothetical protein
MEKPEMVRVIRDCQNADLDYLIPKEKAVELFKAGKLAWDLDNRMYSQLFLEL